jgi:hypothetical protein
MTAGKTMKKLMIALFVISALFFYPHISGDTARGFHNGTGDDVQSIEENEIRLAVENQYIKGLRERDFSLIRAVCIPEATLMGVNQDGKLNITSLESWSKRFDPENPPFEKLDFNILKIDREGTCAQVKVLFLVDLKNHITDFLHMLKVDGKWRIVHIVDY